MENNILVFRFKKKVDIEMQIDSEALCSYIFRYISFSRYFIHNIAGMFGIRKEQPSSLNRVSISDIFAYHVIFDISRCSFHYLSLSPFYITTIEYNLVVLRIRNVYT